MSIFTVDCRNARARCEHMLELHADGLADSEQLHTAVEARMRTVPGVKPRVIANRVTVYARAGDHDGARQVLNETVSDIHPRMWVVYAGFALLGIIGLAALVGVVALGAWLVQP